MLAMVTLEHDLVLSVPSPVSATCGSPEHGWRLTSLNYAGVEMLAANHALADALQEQLPTNTGWEFFANGERWAPSSPKLVAQEPRKVQVNGRTCHLLRSECAGEMAVTLRVETLPDHPAVGLSLQIENLGSETLKLQAIDFAAISLKRSFLQDAVVLNGDTGEAYPPGYTDPAQGPASLVIHRPSDGTGLAALCLAPGRTKKFLFGLGNHLMAGYQRAEPSVEWQLAPGESFGTDACWLIPFQGDPRAGVREGLEAIVSPPSVPQRLTYCSWMPFMEDINQERLFGQMELARELGFEIFLIDGGWEKERRFGERVFDPERFPDGLAGLRQKAEACGLQLGLWTTLNALHAEAEDALAHPDWAALRPDGTPLYTNVGHANQREFCLLSPLAERWLEQIRALVREGNLGYLKVDFPLAYDLYAPAPVVCHASGHEHAIPGEYMLRAYRKAMQLARTLKQEFPHLILDYTYEVWGQWLAMDPSLITVADTCWMANTEDDPAGGLDGPRAVRELARMRSFTIPTRHQALGNLRCDGPDGVRSFYSALAGFPMLLGDLRELAEETRQDLQAAMRHFISLREQVVLGQCDVFAQVNGEASHAAGWSGYLRGSREAKGMLAVFRDSSSHATVTLAFAVQGWLAQADLTLSFQPVAGGGKAFLASVAELQAGIPFTLSTEKSYAVYEFGM